MNDLVDTTEMYLHHLRPRREGVVPCGARLPSAWANGPTVSQTVSRMERDGLLQWPVTGIWNSPTRAAGLAISVMRKAPTGRAAPGRRDRVALGEGHAEACRWEHVAERGCRTAPGYRVLDSRRFRRSNPIPGLAALGPGGSARPTRSGRPGELTELPRQDSVAVVVRQLTGMSGRRRADQPTQEAGVFPTPGAGPHRTGRRVTIMVWRPAPERRPSRMAHAVKVEKV